MKKSDLDKLKTEIQKHDFYYYSEDKPLISDYEYDQLYSQLLAIEEKHPAWVTASSPSQRIGASPLDHFNKVEHRLPMLSLKNSYNADDISSFDERIKKQLSTDEPIEYLCEPKLDGLALSIIYEHGNLNMGLTRGNGRVGENVYSNVKTIRSIPMQLPQALAPELLEVRGEVVILKDDFVRLNHSQELQGLAPFANPRNAAAGTMRQLNPKIAGDRPLRFYAYAPGAATGINFDSQKEFLSSLAACLIPNLGIIPNDQNLSAWFKTTKKLLLKKELPPLCLHSTGILPILDYYKSIEELRNLLPFDIDGIVIKVNSHKLQNIIGSIAKSPKWATAAKFKPEQAQTTIKDIIIQVGRTGALTPVAIMTPVSVGGVNVSQATLHNQDEIDRKDVRIGDQVTIQRAGDVIPEIVSVNSNLRKKRLKKFTLPPHCPACKHIATRLDGEAVLRCLNPLCPAIFSESVKHFASKKAMNIEKLGDKIIEQLVALNLIESFSDIYKLTIDKLLTMDRQGNKSAENIIRSVNASRTPDLNRFVFALGIRFVGEQTASLLAQHFGNIDTILQSTEEEILAIDDIGPKVCTSLLNAFKDKTFLKEITCLIKSGIEIVNPEPLTQETSEQPLNGLNIVVSGSLPMERSLIKSLIIKMGGKSPGSVSKKAHYLLAGEAAGSKLDKALELGIEIIDWDGFQSLIKPVRPN